MAYSKKSLAVRHNGLQDDPTEPENCMLLSTAEQAMRKRRNWQDISSESLLDLTMAAGETQWFQEPRMRQAKIRNIIPWFPYDTGARQSALWVSGTLLVCMHDGS